MATFTQDTALTFRTGSNVSQNDANQKTRDLFRDAARAAQSQLQGRFPDPAAPGYTVAPTVEEIQAMSTAQLKPWIQYLTRTYIRELAKSYRVQAAETTHVKPLREAADETEDVAS